VSAKPHFKIDPETGCWVWQRSLHKQGYGYRASTDTADGLSRLAHRYYWQLVYGPIPDGLSLDHLCRNPPCVNPAHLEPVSHRENVLRGVSLWAENAAKTHCKYGHSLDDAYVRINRNGYPSRNCRTCVRERGKKKRAA
jgi:hypothetical protein